MEVTPSKSFQKQYHKLQPKIRSKVRERITLFTQNPFDSALENHPLTGKYVGCRSINITGDFRLVYQQIEPGIAKLLIVGNHHELYGK
jgi:addiction module RelE/StbE family toxin